MAKKLGDENDLKQERGDKGLESSKKDDRSNDYRVKKLVDKFEEFERLKKEKASVRYHMSASKFDRLEEDNTKKCHNVKSDVNRFERLNNSYANTYYVKL